ncbi:hypothetical protein [Natronorubrum bangense]|uniref:Uncharacterized protein n=2 Tax=Natronorubrum bangense TaxID=61858 RepID=L9WI11_9EURY|nr:hypothetical protein [Natronorubrum bangense]ELY48992.1 hypothetical protein C494_09124 [Natronorubrum bangense JCM 10635]QCC54117.1 hypothetical protein DV706_06195 [Natronorubrum bangense]
MNRELLTFEALFVGQLIGSIILVVGLFLGGLTTLTAVGGAIILCCIVGLAVMATFDETHDRTVETPGGSGRLRSLLSRSSK